MLILALDTTTRAGSLAIVRDGVVVCDMVGDESRTHGERLPADFLRICDGIGVPLGDIDLFAVAAGPGSFTGLRVGIAAIQGLAFAFQRKVVPVSTLEAIVEQPRAAGVRAAAWMDAQRKEVFAAIPGEIDPSSGSPEDVLERWLSVTDLRGIEFHGDGAVRYADRIRAVLDNYVQIATSVPPLARSVGAIAAREPDRAVSPHAIVPLYVRRSDAELARDRRSGS